MPSPLSLLLRRLAVALATVQVAVCALMPMHRPQGDQERGTVRFEAQHQHAELPSHDPDNCAICQLLSTPVLRPEVTRVAPAVDQRVQPVSADIALPSARGPPAAHQTRAPPSLLV